MLTALSRTRNLCFNTSIRTGVAPRDKMAKSLSTFNVVLKPNNLHVYRNLGLRRDGNIRHCLSAMYKLSLTLQIRLMCNKPNETSGRNWERLKKKGNLILMGPPGSGKTTTARLLAGALGKKLLDVDDDLLQPLWRMSVAQKLQQIGDHRFLEEEGRALLNLDDVRDTVISLTGSNPLHKDAMSVAAEAGLCIYLDATNKTVLSRQGNMKVDRIIGMSDGSTLEEVLNSRRNAYEQWHDLRVMVHTQDSPESVAKRVMAAVQRFHVGGSTHLSTRDVSRDNYYSFLEAVLQGLAPDGGLFVSANPIPKFSIHDLGVLVDLGLRERALRVLEAWIHPQDVTSQQLRHFLGSSYTRGLFDHPEMCPVIPLTKNVYVQELFHGPTASFKDWALQLMPRFFAHAACRLRPESKFLILAATSGDTGSATLDGFGRHAGKTQVGALVLYPQRNISKIQKKQTVTMEGKNIKVIGVDGDFDFCQRIVKQIFRDQNIRQALGNCQLSAANSINWGRLLPQILYHVSAYLDLVRGGHINLGDHVDYCIPTGNFGNILSAFYAKEMGVPIRQLICASNSNNILTDFLTTGHYCPAKYELKTTMSPSIDIITSSNLERLLHHVMGDARMLTQFYKDIETKGGAYVTKEVFQQLQHTFVAGFASEEDTQETIRRVFQETGYLLDPHTAVAYHVTTKGRTTPDIPTVVAGTAHFGKFADSILTTLTSTSQDSCDQLTVDEILTAASGLSTRPRPNTLLTSVASKPELHTDTVAADYDQISASVLRFAKSL